jgi:hypothetical protein
MQRQSVISNHLPSVGYDPSIKVLEVEFKNGRIFHYMKVPQREFDALMGADSHGAYLNDHIKSTFSYRELG